MLSTGDHWFVWGLWIGEQGSSALDLFSPHCQGHKLASAEGIVKLAIASPSLIFLQTLLYSTLTSHSLVPGHKYNYQQIVEQMLKVLNIPKNNTVVIFTLKPALLPSRTTLLWSLHSNRHCYPQEQHCCDLYTQTGTVTLKNNTVVIFTLKPALLPSLIEWRGSLVGKMPTLLAEMLWTTTLMFQVTEKVRFRWETVRTNARVSLWVFYQVQTRLVYCLWGTLGEKERERK